MILAIKYTNSLTSTRIKYTKRIQNIIRKRTHRIAYIASACAKGCGVPCKDEHIKKLGACMFGTHEFHEKFTGMVH